MDDFLLIQIFQPIDRLLAYFLSFLQYFIRITPIQILEKIDHIFAWHKLHYQMKFKRLCALVVFVHEVEVLYHILMLQILSDPKFLVYLLTSMKCIICLLVDDANFVDEFAF